MRISRNGSKGWRRTILSDNGVTTIRAKNADAHLERQVTGRDVVVAVTEGKLDFSPGASTVS